MQAYFRSMGSPGASTYSPQAPHPYMQKTRTLEFAIVLEGEIVLVLDTQEVPSSRATSSSSAAPTTRGAIDPRIQRGWPSLRTMESVTGDA